MEVDYAFEKRRVSVERRFVVERGDTLQKISEFKRKAVWGWENKIVVALFSFRIGLFVFTFRMR